MKKSRVLVIGSLVMDLILRTDRFPERGETVTGIDFQAAPGGKGANQAVQCARLGADVTMVGRVGADSFGQALLASLNGSGVETKHVLITDDCASAVGNVQIEVTEQRTSNRIIVAPGANMRLTEGDIEFLRDEIEKYDILILQLEIPMEVNVVAAQIAREKGVLVMLNTAPYVPTPKELLENVTFISPNEHEAALMTGIQITDEQTAREAVQVLREQGVDQVIITLGDKGAAYGNGERFFISPCVKNVAVQDPTAAGDSFVGAFCTAVCAGVDVEQAMKFANHTAALTVSRMGAQPSLPNIHEVMTYMESAGVDISDLRLLADD